MKLFSWPTQTSMWENNSWQFGVVGSNQSKIRMEKDHQVQYNLFDYQFLSPQNVQQQNSLLSSQFSFFEPQHQFCYTPLESTFSSPDNLSLNHTTVVSFCEAKQPYRPPQLNVHKFVPPKIDENIDVQEFVALLTREPNEPCDDTPTLVPPQSSSIKQNRTKLQKNDSLQEEEAKKQQIVKKKFSEEVAQKAVLQKQEGKKASQTSEPLKKQKPISKQSNVFSETVVTPSQSSTVEQAPNDPVDHQNQETLHRKVQTIKEDGAPSFESESKKENGKHEEQQSQQKQELQTKKHKKKKKKSNKAKQEKAQKKKEEEKLFKQLKQLNQMETKKSDTLYNRTYNDPEFCLEKEQGMFQSSK